MLEFDSADLTVLFLGGTGTISASCVRQAVASGMRVSIVNRGRNAAGRDMPDTVESIVADITDDAELDAALGRRHFDAVVNFLSYDASDADRMVGIFDGPDRTVRTHQFRIDLCQTGRTVADLGIDPDRAERAFAIRDGQVAGRGSPDVGPPGEWIPADHRPPVPYL